MFTRSRPNSRVIVCVSLMLGFALTANLLVFPSAASYKSASSGSGTLAGSAGIAGQAPSARATQEPSAAIEARAQENYGKLGVQFEANHGQTDKRVKFITRASGATVFLTPTEAVFVLSAPNERAAATQIDRASRPSGERADEPATRKTHALWMKIEGANQTVQIEGQEKLPGIVNYFKGYDPAKWHTDIPTFANVRYAGIYEGVDLVYYSNADRQLEYDFVVKPGADAAQLSLAFEGADSLTVDSATGDLLIGTSVGEVRQRKPVVYQEAGGERHEVDSGYQLKGAGRVGFRVGAYDRAKPLVIDPVLVYSTYLGGSNDDRGTSIAVDSAGNAYVAGRSFSTNFPTTPGAFQTSGDRDGFVTKLNAAGSARIYSTYLGGSGATFDGDSINGIGLDSAGNAYVSGQTDSSDFPTTPGAVDSTLNGVSDAFAAKLNAAGSALIYSTYFGGNGGEDGAAIALDSAGNAYVTGFTGSFAFPTVNPIDNTRDGPSDAFVTKLNAVGSALVYSTYLGGSQNESGMGIAVDSTGNAYVTGLTGSTDFPRANAIQSAYGGSEDAFVTKLNAAGSALIYSTYLGGGGIESGNGIAVDASGNAYVTGFTGSTDFPKKNEIDSTLANLDAFVAKLNAAGSALAYSTYLGGNDAEFGLGIAVDSAGNAYVTGDTTSTDFPTANAIDNSLGGVVDAFVAKINASGSALLYSTYLGGSSADSGAGIAADSAGNAYLTGITSSINFPTTPEAFQPGDDAGPSLFVSKIGSFSISGRVVDSAANPISGVIITLSGSGSATTTTDSNGYFVFLSTTPGGEYEVTPVREGFTFSPQGTHISSLNSNRNLIIIGGSADATPTPTPTPTSTGIFQFSAASFAVDEGAGRFQIIVTRSGDTSQAATIDYATNDGTANERGDYTTSIGTLRFAAADTAESFDIFVTDDAFVEGNETIQITLSNPSAGSQLGGMVTTLLTIVDNDLNSTSVNPIDSTSFFVRQHYVDFFGREPDAAGLAFWINNIDSCGADAACRAFKRTDTSAAFFLSIEFQETGFLIHRATRAAFNRFPRFREFIRDNRELGRAVVVGQGAWAAQLEANKQAYFDEFITRTEFVSIYGGLTNEQYVDALNANTSASLTAAERNALVAGLNGATETRATVLRKVAEDADFTARARNPAFVLAEYFGYLRRNPDDPPDTSFEGFNFWLNKLNQFGGDFRAAEMVKSFLVSTEYRSRFGSP